MREPGDPAGNDALDSTRLQDAAVKGAAWTMVHTVVSVPIAFLVNLLLAQVLAPVGYGRLAFLTTLIGIAGSVLALGLTPAMIQYGSRAHAAGRTAEVTQILSSSQGFRLLVVAPVLTILVLLVVDVPWPLLVLALAFGVWVPALLDGAPIALFIENKTASGAKIVMLSNLIVQAGVVITVLWIGTADSVWAIRVVLTALTVALALISISQSYRRAVLRPRLPKFPPGFWRFALPTGAAGLIGELVVSRTEVLFLEWLSTPTAVGLFALAFGVSSHIFAPAQALTGPLIPAVAGLREVAPAKVSDAFDRSMRATSTIVALLVASALAPVTLLVPFLYGKEFVDAAPALLVLGLVGGLAVSTGPLSAFVLARLSARLFLIANVGALIVDLALALTLIPTFGLWGAVVANASGTLTRLVILWTSEARELQIPMSKTLTTLLPTGIAGVASIASWQCGLVVPAQPLVQALVSAALGLGLLIIGLRASNTGLTEADGQALLRALPEKLRGAAEVPIKVVSRSD